MSDLLGDGSTADGAALCTPRLPSMTGKEECRYADRNHEVGAVAIADGAAICTPRLPNMTGKDELNYADRNHEVGAAAPAVCTPRLLNMTGKNVLSYAHVREEENVRDRNHVVWKSCSSTLEEVGVGAGLCLPPDKSNPDKGRGMYSLDVIETAGVALLYCDALFLLIV